MDKYSKAVVLSEEIGKAIELLHGEVIGMENLYLKNKKIVDLKKENDLLEEEIELYKKELADLEIFNGRKQIPSVSNKIGEDSNKEKEITSQNVPNVIQRKAQPCTANDDPKFKKSEKKKKDEATKKGGNKKVDASEENMPVDVGRLDLKVGRIVEIKKHEDADSLYVEKIDIGRAQPITVVSGLVKHVPIEEMENRLVIVLCNLKPAKMRGITSEAMVMCASSPEKVEVLIPPQNSKPGDMVTVPGYPPPLNGPEPVLNPKKKIFETLAPELKTDSECCATFRGVQWEVSGGLVKSATLKNVNIK